VTAQLQNVAWVHIGQKGGRKTMLLPASITKQAPAAFEINY